MADPKRDEREPGAEARAFVEEHTALFHSHSPERIALALDVFASRAIDSARREARKEALEQVSAIREHRDALSAMVERLVPADVLSRDGTVAGIERYILSRVELDYESVGRACMDAIIEGSMIRTVCPGAHVFLWNGNAAEQIGEALKRADLAFRALRERGGQ